MRSLTRIVTGALLTAASLLLGYTVYAQRGQAAQASPVQIGASSPLPVYVTNTPSLPEGFVAGSRWRFTTWTTPSVFTWTATVNRTSGAWAHMTVRDEGGASTSRWYYVPAMPGSWEQQ